MRKAVTELNKGVIVSKKNLHNLNNKYIRIYLNACKNLYEANYIDSPVIFNKRLFFKALSEEFNDLLPSLFSKSTMLVPESVEFFDYLIKLYSDNKEFCYAINEYKTILEAQKIFEGINSYKYLKFKKKSDIKDVTPRINISTSVKIKSKYMQDNTVNLYALKHEGKVIKFDYTYVYIKYLMKDLNIQGYEEYKSNNKSVFLGDKFTFEDDCKYLDLLLNGDIVSDTENGQKLIDLVDNFNSTLYDTYFNKLFIDAVDEINVETNKYRESIKQFNPKEYYVTSKSLYLEVNIYTGFINALGYEYYDFNIGSAIYDYDTGDKLNPLFRLLGYSGEFVSSDYIESQGLKCNGLPVILDNNTEFYPLFNVPEIIDNYEKYNIYANIDRHIIKEIRKYMTVDIDSSISNYIYTIVESLLCADLDVEPETKYKDIDIENKDIYLEQAIRIYERMTEDYGIS